MSMHLRNSRDMMTTDDAGWWVSKTPLEQKLIILSSVLFILSFCLTISVIVLDNRKPPACGLTTTLEPSTNATISSTDPPPDTNVTEPVEPPVVKPEENKENETKGDENKEGGNGNKEDGSGNKDGQGNADVNATPEALTKSSTPAPTTKEDTEGVKDTNAKAWADGNPTSAT